MEEEEARPLSLGVSGTLEATRTWDKEVSGADLLLCSVLKRPHSAHTGFCVDVKVRGKKGRGRNSLNKESFQKSSWQKINRSDLKAAQQTPPDGPAHQLHFEIAGPGIYITWPVR